MVRKLNILVISLIIGLVVISFVQYQENKRLKDTLGSTYLSNISNFSQHIDHLETYLQNENEFTENDINNYYYEVNYLLTVRLPSDSFISLYIGFIQNGLSTMSTLISKEAKNEEIEMVRNRTLKLVLTLKEELGKMSKVGRVVVKDGIKENYGEYYKLSLPGNKTMKSINSSLEQQLQKHMEILNNDN